jgi:hypothetical protein
MELFELKIDDELFDEVFAISLVSEPAIESNFVFFDKEKVQFAKIDTEKRIVAGPVLIPNKKILRVDGEGKPYEVFFSPQTVEKLAQNYLKRRYNNKSTLEHEEDINGVSLVESWIKTTKLDKSNGLGLNLPVGTWVGLFKIDNDEIWNEYVKNGSVKGFSIEGIFTHDLVKASREELLLIQEEEAQYLLNRIRALIKEDKRYSDKKRVDMESYSDYPQSVKNNAKRGIELNERQGNKCGTQVGKVRAQQLAKGEPISEATIKRMYSYLSRAETYYDPNKTTECGTISYLLWGGKSALGWSRNKLRELGLLEENSLQQPSVTSTYPGEVASGSISPQLDLDEEYPRRILFPEKEMAEQYAMLIGCEGSHPHTADDGNTYYMPCLTHPETDE